ncbi:gas vesicle protein GvpN [Methanosarcina sp. Mfa9]|uniref:gas vesicle protein GvpN n=1 Tax=Methanosarcina sp. Mfa9 TaxID=3439063 RepID=UPI003F860761
MPKGGPGAKPVEAEVTRNNESGSNEYGGLSPQNENFVSTATVNYLAQRVEAWLRIGYPVHLIGPTGCGKTSLAMHIAKNIGRPIVWINGDEAVTTKDLVGGYAQVKKETLIDNFVHNVSKKTEVTTPEWVDNPLTSACRHGYTLIYNEFSRTRPVANNVLLSIFEEGILELPTKNGQERYVKVHPEFRAIMTSNSVEYSGVHRPQDALLDRIISIHMDYYDFDTEMSIVRKHAGISEEAARKIVSIVRKVRERMDLAHKPGTRACIMVGKALKNLGGENEIPLEQLLMDVIAAKASSYQDLLKKQKFVREGIAEMENTG